MRRSLLGVVPVVVVIALACVPEPPEVVIFGNTDPDFALILFRGDVPDFFADDFVLQAGASEITDIHWWGVYGGGDDDLADDDFTIQIFADNGSGAPELTPSELDLHAGAVVRTRTGETFLGQDVYVYSLDIAPLALDPGVNYYISIENDTSPDTDNWGWLSNGAAGEDFWFRFATGNPWVLGETPNGFAFYLTSEGT